MTTDPITHAVFCTPQPGEPGPRIDVFRAERTDDNGHVISRPLVRRCLECAEQIVQG